MSAEKKVKKEVESLLRRGHRKERIHRHMVKEGHEKHHVDAAFKETEVKRSGIPKSRYVHLLIILTVISIISIPLVSVYRSASYNPPLLLDLDYTGLQINDISSFKDHFEAAINMKDGNLYFALLSPELQDLACMRWEAIGNDLEYCIEGMGDFYSQEIFKRFGEGTYQVSIQESSQTQFGTRIQGAASGEKDIRFTIYLTQIEGSYNLASDYLIDVAIS